MTEKPGRIGKQYPVAQTASNNSAPTAQASVTGDRYGLVALILGIVAIVLAVALLVTVWSISKDVDNVRGLIENSAASASQAAVDAALASERADKAERSAALNREYAVQVVGQLNRMGYPVISPGEQGHPPALPADYAKLDAYKDEHDGHH